MIRIEPRAIRGEVKAPPSKSMTQRALVAALLAKGESQLLNLSDCDDARSALAAIELLGARARREQDRLVVTGGGEPLGREIDCGESGLLMRLLAPVAALFPGETVLEASGTLARRPMEMLCGPIIALGGGCRTEGGLPPLTVRGPLAGGRAEVDASLTSQALSGLLMALPLCDVGSRLGVPVLSSRPYVLMTLELLKSFGVAIHHDGAWRRIIVAGRQRYVPCAYEIEGDWSSAAALLAAGAIGGEARVFGLRPDSRQADKAILSALRLAGATVRLDESSATASGGPLRGFDFDVAEAPDLLPPLAAIAAQADGTSRISGIGRARHKESDRVLALVEELGRLGARIQVDGNALVIEGRRLHGGRVGAHGDHRIAMACALAGLRAEGVVEIEGAESVSKSYPGFFEALDSLSCA